MRSTALFLACLASATAAAAPHSRAPEETVRINIGTTAACDLDQALALLRARYDFQVRRRLARIGVLTIEIDRRHLDDLRGDRALNALVDYLEPDGVARIPEDGDQTGRHLAAPRDRARPLGQAPSDPYYDRQWAPACVDLERA